MHGHTCGFSCLVVKHMSVHWDKLLAFRFCKETVAGARYTFGAWVIRCVNVHAINSQTSGSLFVEAQYYLSHGPVVSHCKSCVEETALFSLPLHLFLLTVGDGERLVSCKPCFHELHWNQSQTLTVFSLDAVSVVLLTRSSFSFTFLRLQPK